jgi:hypothetical protein
MKRFVFLSIALLLLAAPLSAGAQAPRVPDTVGATPPILAPAATAGPHPEATGRLYKTSLDVPDSLFEVYDPATDAWTALTPYETGAQMAVSGSRQLYAYGINTQTIDVYDPATDTWSPVIPAPPGATGYYGNLEITANEEFLYTEPWGYTLWYTVGGVWNTMTLPFACNVMGDYEPATNQYVIGEAWTTNAHLIDLNTWAITDYTSPVGNGEYARFGVVMDNLYVFEAGGSPIHYFDLGNPAAPPVDTGNVLGFYSSASADRANHTIYVASLDGTQLWVYDLPTHTYIPLTGGSYGWHSSLAFVDTGQPPANYAHLWKTKMQWAQIMEPYYFKVVVRGFVHDQFHAAAAGVTLSGFWTYPDGSTHEAMAVTDGLGRWKVPLRLTPTPCGLFQFEVTDLAGPGYTYDPGANETNPHTQILVPCK